MRGVHIVRFLVFNMLQELGNLVYNNDIGLGASDVTIP